ncbi:class I SAM-dependent methyltransferase [Nitrosospira multiformis]|uniref:SAM-dependent methyltransferase, MidA family n=1 Tax=Nitrosospira multiformis TaxID=1231 RepID=A0A1I7GEX9_9PROT|nr:SAM-dependent methyltransferase [Nitrosospira multiformis]SFU47000.1 SAM-dependent methyltransferase, MidA family [Nitrosospira multiformis]
MQPQPPFPAPSEAALEHSRALTELIHAEISAAGGWISFEYYMRLGLYAPGRGYYSGGAVKFGQEGDFVTAPEISSLFGRTVARQARQILELTGDDSDILEFGAGTGKLALDLLIELEKLGCLPQQYFILEVSAELQQRQRQLLEQFASHLASRVHWLKRLPEQFDGLILANEVLDAMPVHLVAWRGDALYERGVSSAGNEFVWSERPLAEGVLFEAARELADRIRSGGNEGEYVSEICLEARGFIASLGKMLQRGAILLIDYGFGRDEYYHPQRRQGTLMCHYRHNAHDNPFYLPGLQDITNHVDFSAVADSGTEAGLELLGYTTQAHFLINCGITEILAETPAGNTRDYLPLANQVQKLVSPAEMGELFKVMILGKGIRRNHPPPVGFTGGDKSRLL